MAEKLRETREITVLHDTEIQMGTSNQTKKFDGDNLDRFDPIMVLFEYMKKDNLRVIDLFQVGTNSQLPLSDPKCGDELLVLC